MAVCSVPTLEALLRLRIGVELWSLTDIKATLVRLLVLCELDWKTVLLEMHRRIRLKILSMPLPDAQKQQLLRIVRPIGVQIQSWLGRYKYLFLNSNQRIRAFVNCICWTSTGSVDEKKSTILLLDSGDLDVISSYKLACSFCLDGHVSVLYQKLCECKIDTNRIEKIGSWKPHVLVSYWNNVMKNDHCLSMKLKLDAEKSCFLDSIRTNNVWAAKYFWHRLKPKLNEEERENILLKSLINIAHCVCRSYEKPPFYYPMHFRSGLVFYLYMKLSQSSRFAYFSNHLNHDNKAIMGLLLAFLNWPFHELFSNLNAYFWSLAPPVEEYALLVRFMWVKIEAEKENFCPSFLNNIWSEIPYQYIETCKSLHW